MVDNGASLNAVDGKGLSPLMHACALGKKKGSDIAMYLLGNGADVSYTRTSDEMTALKFAARQASAEVISGLIANGAEVDGPTGTEQTALMMAARSDNVPAIKMLLKHGAKPELKCGLPWAEGRTAAQLAELESSRKAIEYFQDSNSALNAS